MSDELHAENGAPLFERLGGRLGHLDAAAFAAAAGVNLRLDDHDLIAGLVLHATDGGFQIVDLENRLTDGNRDVVTGEELLGLVLVDLQGRPPSWKKRLR